MFSLLSAQPSADSVGVGFSAIIRSSSVVAALALSVAGGAIAQPMPELTDKIIEPSLSSGVATHASNQLISQTQEVVTGSVVNPPALPAPAPQPFSPDIAGIVDLSRGANAIESLGQLRPRDVEGLSADNVDWLKSVILPLYTSPGGEHWGWIYKGWLIPKGQPYLAIGRDAGFAMVKAYKNLYTFPVLEARDDGWFRVQYTQGGSAWAHSSQLALGDMPLVVEGWEALLQAQDSVYFLQTDEAQALRSQPETTANMLSLIPANSLIKPLAFQGDWMQVRITRPATPCRALTGATVTEGWMRWRNAEHKSLVWYRPNTSCSAAG
ncbi:MAG: hypothetical protein WBA76_08040 [Phormidesmis sp.]